MKTARMEPSNAYWLPWTQYCALGELLGIGAAGGMAYAVNHLVGEPVTTAQKLVVLLCMMMAGAMEGSLLGWFQWRVLRKQIEELPALEWIGLTMTVAIMGWFLGMLPSLFFIEVVSAPSAANEPSAFDSPWMAALLSVAMGLGAGAVFGLFQWFSLRKYVLRANRWIIANSLGWAVGVSWIYLAASLPDADTTLPVVLLLGIVGGILAGLSVGAITGLYLVAILKEPKPPSFRK